MKRHIRQFQIARVADLGFPASAIYQVLSDSEKSTVWIRGQRFFKFCKSIFCSQIPFLLLTISILCNIVDLTLITMVCMAPFSSNQGLFFFFSNSLLKPFPCLFGKRSEWWRPFQPAIQIQQLLRVEYYCDNEQKT